MCVRTHAHAHTHTRAHAHRERERERERERYVTVLTVKSVFFCIMLAAFHTLSLCFRFPFCGQHSSGKMIFWCSLYGVAIVILLNDLTFDKLTVSLQFWVYSSACHGSSIGIAASCCKYCGCRISPSHGGGLQQDTAEYNGYGIWQRPGECVELVQLRVMQRRTWRWGRCVDSEGDFVEKHCQLFKSCVHDVWISLYW